MARRYIGEIAAAAGEQVTVCGWIEAVKRAGDGAVWTVRDHTGSVQASCRRPEEITGFEPLREQSAVSLIGTVRRARANELQLEVEEVREVVAATGPSPLQGNSGLSERLDHRYLDLRAPGRFTLFDVRATIEAAAQDFLADQGFIGIRTPKITGGGSESGASVFELPYFGETACLVQSVQFYAQMAIAGGFDRVFEIGPVFRAENSLSNRHATEFTVLHVELAWPDSHETLMRIEEELVGQMLERIGDRHGEAIEEHFGMRVRRIKEEIPRVTLAEALAMLGEEASDPEADQLTARDERALGKLVHQQHGHDFVFVTDFPESARPFYTMSEGEGGGAGALPTRSFDLLWRGIEITSGAQREHRLERLRTQAEAQLGAEALAGYLEPYFLEMFNYGCPPHGGFGLGIDRFAMILLGEASLRETSLFFRGPERFMP